MKRTLNEEVDRMRAMMLVKINEELDNAEAHDEPYTRTISVSMAIMSHLSDLQVECPSSSGKINFIKSLVLELSDGVKEMTDDELNQNYRKWTQRELEEQDIPIDEAGNTGAQNNMKLDAKTRQNINKDLTRLMAPTYFKAIPLDEIFGVLEKHGVVVLQEDQTIWDGFLLGRDGHTYLSLGYARSKYLGNNDIPTYEEINNARLTVTWHKMEGSGKIEVLAFIS